SGDVNAANGGELEAAIASRGNGSDQIGFALSAPVELTFKEKVVPGTYSVCVIPLVGDLNDPATIERLQREGDTLPVTCKKAVVADSPPEQRMTIEATAPPPPPTPKL